MALVTVGLCWTSPPLLPSHRSGHLLCLWPLDLAGPSMLCHQLTCHCSAGHSVHSFSVQCRGHIMSNRMWGNLDPPHLSVLKQSQPAHNCHSQFGEANLHVFTSNFFLLDSDSEGEAGYRFKPQGLTWIRSPHLF